MLDRSDLAPRLLARDDDPFTNFGRGSRHGSAAEPSITPAPMGIAQSRSIQMAATNSGPPNIAPQDLLPRTINRNTIVTREAQKPIGLNGMRDFRSELTKNASAHLAPQVSATVEQINKHIKGGGLVRSNVWTQLKALVTGRRDRADKIISLGVSAQTLASAGDPRAALDKLLDGQSSPPVTQAQDDRRMKDPDVGNPSDFSDS
jgi:hypothetical protein